MNLTNSTNSTNSMNSKNSINSINCSSGFTLIELISVVVIMGVIVTQMYTILRNTHRTGQKIEEIIVGTEMVPALMTLLSKDLRMSFKSDETEEFFAGRTDKLDFYTLNHVLRFNEQKKKVDIYRMNKVKYSVTSNSKKTGYYILTRTIEPVVTGEEQGGNELTSSEIITDKLKKLSFTYVDETFQAYEEWNSSEKDGKMPHAVFIEMEAELYESSKQGESKVISFTFKVPLMY